MLRIDPRGLRVVAYCGCALATLTLVAGIFFPTLLRTPDQIGQALYQEGKFAQAAEQFQSRMRRGVALYRAGQFEQAANCFASFSSADAKFNRGNCLMLMGKYEAAAEQYELALQLTPDWLEAEENRTLALARAEMVKEEGGDAGDQRIGADEIVFDQNGKNENGEDTEVDSAESQDDSVQARWLRRVQTKPADFLKYKFAYQASFQEDAK